MSDDRDRRAEVGTTIVGGQPRKARRVKVEIPVGVERALMRAAADPAFKQALLSDREATLEGSGLRLRESERALLRAAPEAALEAMIGSLDVSPDNLQRRLFMQTVAAGAVALTAGGCGEDSKSAPLDSGPPGEGIPPDTVPQAVDVATPDMGIRDEQVWDQFPSDTVPHQVDGYTGDRGILPDAAPPDMPLTIDANLVYPGDGVHTAGIRDK